MGDSQHDPIEAQDPPGSVVVTIHHTPAEFQELAEAIVAAMAEQCLGSDAAQFAVRLALEQAVSNAVRHGNRDRHDGRIEVAYHVDARRLFIRVTDEGHGFDPSSIADPPLDEYLECPSGRNLLLMRAYMTRVEFPAPGNTVRMYFENPPTS